MDQAQEAQQADLIAWVGEVGPGGVDVAGSTALLAADVSLQDQAAGGLPTLLEPAHAACSERGWGGSRPHLCPRIMPYACSSWRKLLTNPQHPSSNCPGRFDDVHSHHERPVPCTGSRGRKPQLCPELFCVGSPSLSRTRCSTTNSRLASRPENWHPARPLQMPGPRHVRVCGPALASRLCPLSRQRPGQPSPRPAAPPRLTRLLLTPTGEHSLCVSSLPWDGDGGRGPRGGGLAPSEASRAPAGPVGARTRSRRLSSPVNDDSRTPTPPQN